MNHHKKNFFELCPCEPRRQADEQWRHAYKEGEKYLFTENLITIMEKFQEILIIIYDKKQIRGAPNYIRQEHRKKSE